MSDQLKQCWSYNPEDRPDFNALELTIKQFRNNLNNEEFINFENEQNEDNKINPIVMGTAQVNAQDKYQTLDCSPELHLVILQIDCLERSGDLS